MSDDEIMMDPTPPPKPKRKSGRPKGTPMSTAHKKALGTGNRQTSVVRRYLKMLAQGREVSGYTGLTPEQIQMRLNSVERDMLKASPLDRLALAQQALELRALLDDRYHNNFMECEYQFVRVGKVWAERSGISYEAFRALDVPEEVLTDAGIFPSPPPRPRPELVTLTDDELAAFRNHVCTSECE